MVQQGEGLGLTVEDPLGDGDVRGQLAPRAEARAGEAVHAVLTGIGRSNRLAVLCGCASSRPVIGIRLANTVMPSTSSTEEPPAHAHRTGGRTMEERRQLVVVTGCGRSGHEVVTDTPGAEHHTILPARARYRRGGVSPASPAGVRNRPSLSPGLSTVKPAVNPPRDDHAQGYYHQDEPKRLPSTCRQNS